MARPVRIDVEDHWYHVIARGQRGDRLFHAAADFRKYLQELDRAVVRRGGLVGAYCLMDNHIHLLVYRGGHSLASIMQLVHSRYAKYFNLSHRKKGYVFQGRYKAFLVLDDRYLIKLIQYIHRNPIEAGIARRADLYRWSSDRYYRHGTVDKYVSLTRVPEFEGRGSQSRYRTLIDSSECEKLPIYKTYIGDERLARKIERRATGRGASKWMEKRGLPDVRVRSEELAAEFGRTLAKLQLKGRRRAESHDRQKIMIKLYAEGFAPTEIARTFRKTPSTVFRALERN